MSGVLPTPERMAQEIRSLLSSEGYRARFGARWSQVMGVPEDVVDRVLAAPSLDAGAALLEGVGRTPAAMAAELEACGVEHTVIHNPPPTEGGLTNGDLARRVREAGGHYVGFARFDPARCEQTLEEARRHIVDDGFRGVSVTPFWHATPATDPVYEPLWALCQELDVVCYVHCSTHQVRAIPINVEHPSHLDELAGRHPSLRILAGHGGWPWVPEMVAVALRHPTLVVELATFPPRHLAAPGSGWDVLWYHLPRSLQDQVVWGTTWQLLGRPLPDLVAELQGLGLPAAVEHKVLHANAARLLRL